MPFVFGFIYILWLNVSKFQFHSSYAVLFHSISTAFSTEVFWGVLTPQLPCVKTFNEIWLCGINVCSIEIPIENMFIPIPWMVRGNIKGEEGLKSGTFSEAISFRCFTLTSSAGSLLVTKSRSLLACVWLFLSICCPFSRWIFHFSKKSCFTSSSFKSAGFSASPSATCGMLTRRSWISFLVKSFVLRASLIA